VQAFGAHLVDLRPETKVDGDVQGQGTRSIIVRGENKNTFVGGNIQLTEASAASTEDALSVESSRVGGWGSTGSYPGRACISGGDTPRSHGCAAAKPNPGVRHSTSINPPQPARAVLKPGQRV
jgi:hypothetical protein